MSSRNRWLHLSLFGLVSVAAALCSDGTASATPRAKKAPPPASGKATAPAPSAPSAPSAPKPYPPEPKAPNAGLMIKGCGYFTKMMVQTYLGNGQWGPPQITMGGSENTATSCSFPSPPAGGAWAAWQRQAISENKDDMSKGDVILIPANSKFETSESSDGSTGRYVDVYWYSRTQEFTLNACGDASEDTVCEVSGSKFARGINVAHFRLDEATKAKGTDKGLCAEAARLAVATSRGALKLRKTLKANDEWVDGKSYKTRYDGKLSETAAVSALTKLGADALKVHVACGGTKTPTTTDAEETAFLPK
jgi:hypothetical protein